MAMQGYNSQWLVLGGWLLGWILPWRVPGLPRNAPADPMGAVTIVIPARNEAHRLPVLLGCLTDGLRESAHVVVVDDHSADETRAIAQRYPNVRVIGAPELAAATATCGRRVHDRHDHRGLCARGCSRSISRGTFTLSPARIMAIVIWLACACSAFSGWGGPRTWLGFALTAMFAIQMGVMFRQVGAFGWADALLYPVHVVFIAIMFVLGTFNVRFARRVHWQGRTVPLADD
jgi:glycosyltransferase involved in cell wall biosynthesis